MRLTLDCTAATMFPRVIERMAMMEIAMTSEERLTCPRPPSMKTRMRAAKPAALEPTEKKAVDGVGAPSEMSGPHMWNRTPAILMPKHATDHNTAPRTTRY